MSGVLCRDRYSKRPHRRTQDAGSEGRRVGRIDSWLAACSARVWEAPTSKVSTTLLGATVAVAADPLFNGYRQQWPAFVSTLQNDSRWKPRLRPRLVDVPGETLGSLRRIGSSHGSCRRHLAPSPSIRKSRAHRANRRTRLRTREQSVVGARRPEPLTAKGLQNYGAMADTAVGAVWGSPAERMRRQSSADTAAVAWVTMRG